MSTALDFSGYTAGASVFGNGFTEEWDSDWTLTAETETGADGGQIIQLTPGSSSTRRAASIDALGTISDGELFFRYRPRTTGDNLMQVIHFRGSGTSGNESAYRIGARFGLSSATMLLQKYASGSTSTVATGTDMPSSGRDQWVNFLVNLSGSTIKVKAWTGDRTTDEPAAWNIDTTDSSHTSGWVGPSCYSQINTQGFDGNDFDFVGFNASGAAPRTLSPVTTAPTTAPTINSVTPGASTADVDYSTVADAASYEYRLDSGIAQVAGTSPYTISGLAEQTAYGLEMRGVNSVGAGPWSAVTSFTTQAASGATLTYDADFDGANLDYTQTTITNPATANPVMAIKPRTQNSEWRQFFFRLDGAQGKKPTFTIDGGTYVSGITSLWRPWYSTDKLNWIKSTTAPDRSDITAIAFQFDAAFTTDTVYIAFEPAYPVERSAELIDWFETNYPALIHDAPSSGPDHIITTLAPSSDRQGRTIPSQPMYSYVVRDDSQTATGGEKRPVIINGGIHAGEHSGDWAMQYLLEYLTSGTTQAGALLKEFEFYVYPCLNPIGRWGGSSRWSFENLYQDPNRDWGSNGFHLSSTQALRDAFIADFDGKRPVLQYDFHGAYNINHGDEAFYALQSDWTDSTIKAHFDEALATQGNYAADPSTLTTNIRKWVNDNLLCEHTYTIEFKAQELGPDQASLRENGQDLARTLYQLYQTYPGDLDPTVPDYSGLYNVQTTSYAFATDVTTLSCPLPADIAAGELLLLQLSLFNNGTVTPPSGWTPLYDYNLYDDAVDSYAGGLYRIADGSEAGTTVDVTTTAATTAAALLYQINGAQAIEAGTVLDDAGSYPNPGSVTASWGRNTNLFLALGHAFDDDQAFTDSPAGYTLAGNTVSGGGMNNGAEVGGAYRTINAATDNPGSFALSGSESWAAVTAVIQPAAGGIVALGSRCDLTLSGTSMLHAVQQMASLGVIQTQGQTQLDRMPALNAQVDLTTQASAALSVVAGLASQADIQTTGSAVLLLDSLFTIATRAEMQTGASVSLAVTSEVTTESHSALDATTTVGLVSDLTNITPVHTTAEAMLALNQSLNAKADIITGGQAQFTAGRNLLYIVADEAYINPMILFDAPDIRPH